MGDCKWMLCTFNHHDTYNDTIQAYHMLWVVWLICDYWCGWERVCGCERSVSGVEYSVVDFRPAVYIDKGKSEERGEVGGSNKRCILYMLMWMLSNTNCVCCRQRAMEWGLLLVHFQTSLAF